MIERVSMMSFESDKGKDLSCTQLRGVECRDCPLCEAVALTF